MAKSEPTLVRWILKPSPARVYLTSSSTSGGMDANAETLDVVVPHDPLAFGGVERIDQFMRL